MAEIIDRALAQILIKSYQARNTSQQGPQLLTTDQLFLNGYYIDRASLEAVLSNPQFSGITVYLGTHPDCMDSLKNIFTLIFTGAVPNPVYTAGDGATVSAYLNPGDIYEQVQSCPPYCGSL